MLPIKNRLTKKDDFQIIHKKGSFFSNKEFSLLHVKNGLDVSRFGIIVSKKTFAKATDRNRIRRIVREILRTKLAQIKTGFNVVMHVKTQKIASTKEIEAVIEQLLKNSFLLK